MRKILAVWVLLVGVPGFGQIDTQAQSSNRERAVAVVDEMMHAMGGVAAWEKVRILRFDWVVERESGTVAYARHLWDRYDGRYRVEWESREGEAVVALFNVNTRAGRAFVNGQPARDGDEQKYLDRAYGRFINDSYWLLMPWKLKDPGVKLEYAGETQLEGNTCDLVKVSFESVGLTPGDHYWAYINRQTHLMDRWAYFLERYEGAPNLERATPWNWGQWELVGGIRLARDKLRVGENAKIYFPVLQVLDGVEAQVFESLDAQLPGPAPGRD
jgi:hypothetical protein